jgi:hypothetical protein
LLARCYQPGIAERRTGEAKTPASSAAPVSIRGRDMTDNDRLFLDWGRETWQRGTEIAIADHEEKVRFEEEAICRVTRARAAVEKAREDMEEAERELSEALGSLEIRRRLRRESQARLEDRAGKAV